MWTRHRVEIHGHIVEGRLGYLGAQTVLLDGKLVSNQPFGGWYSPGHFFELTDESGRARLIEVRFKYVKAGLSAAMLISVDGADRARIPATKDLDPRVCRNCGYSLAGTEELHREYACPECGRHTPAF